VPIVACSVCRRVYKIMVRDWKLTCSDSDQVCSLKCTQSWIVDKPRARRSPQEQGALPFHNCNRPLGDYSPQFRSRLEHVFSEWLTEQGIVWSFEQWVFSVRRGWYIPDFYLPDYHCFIETKGGWAPGSKTKMRNFYAQYPKAELLVLPWMLGRKMV
jgi:hypothetical protein